MGYWLKEIQISVTTLGTLPFTQYMQGAGGAKKSFGQRQSSAIITAHNSWQWNMDGHIEHKLYEVVDNAVSAFESLGIRFPRTKQSLLANLAHNNVGIIIADSSNAHYCYNNTLSLNKLPDFDARLIPRKNTNLKVQRN